MPKKNLFERISQPIGRASSYLFLVIVVIATYEVVMRYAFNAPTTWVHEVSVMLAASAFVIGVYNLAGGRGFVRELFTGLAVPPLMVLYPQIALWLPSL